MNPMVRRLGTSSRTRMPLLTVSLAAAVALAACEPPQETASDAGTSGFSEPAGSLVEVTSTGMNFQAPSEIDAGWTTFRYTNESDVTHFLVVERLPAGRTVEDSRSDVVPVFQDAMDLIMDGEPEAGFAQFANLPEWFSEVAFVGGPGMTAPGATSQATVNLEPGTYVIECYVKAPDGTFHSSLGMIAGFTVREADAGGAEPEADVTITLANDGMTLDGSPGAGEQTFRARFQEQMAHENALGHDVHLFRMTEETDETAVAAWMNWAAPEGLTTPAPVEFLGGTHELPAGGVAYFTAMLSPGSYGLVAEVPDPVGKGLFATFEVQ